MSKPQSKRPGPTSTLTALVEPINIGGVVEELPTVDSAPVVVAAAAPPVEVAEPAVALTAAPEVEAVAEPEVEAERKPVTVRLQTDLIEQAKAAVYASRMDTDGYDTFQDLVEEAVMKEVELLAKHHNHGEPFTPLPKFRRGRPFKRN